MSTRSDRRTRVTVLVALAANLVIAAAKAVGGLLAASPALLSEAAHSVADSLNEVFLLAALRRSRRPADRRHPFGYGKERFFWSLLAAVGNDLRELASACSQLIADTDGKIGVDTVARYYRGRAEVSGFTAAVSTSGMCAPLRMTVEDAADRAVVRQVFIDFPNHHTGAPCPGEHRLALERREAVERDVVAAAAPLPQDVRL